MILAGGDTIPAGIDANQYRQLMFSQNQPSRTAQGVGGCILRAPELNSQLHTRELGALLDTEEWNRLRWQCRRGLLELDLVLERFLEKHGDQLQGERLSSFQTLLTYADDELWDLVRARTECREARFAEVVQWLRNCRDRTGC